MLQPCQQLVLTADQMCQRVSTSPSNSVLCSGAEGEAAAAAPIGLLVHQPPSTDAAAVITDSVEILEASRFPCRCLSQHRLITEPACAPPFIRLLAVLPFILSVNRQQRAGDETHGSDTANNTHLSRRAGSITKHRRMRRCVGEVDKLNR